MHERLGSVFAQHVHGRSDAKVPLPDPTAASLAQSRDQGPQGPAAGTRRLAREIRKQTHYIGFFPLVVHAALRDVRVHVFVVARIVDLLAEYAPMLPPPCAEMHPLAVVVFCRCLAFSMRCAAL